MVTAHCDTSTGKIYDCEENSFSWWHEKGHLIFNSSSTGSKLLLFQNYIFYIWMLFVSLGLFFRINIIRLMSIILLIPYFGIALYEELWCNKFARDKLNG